MILSWEIDEMVVLRSNEERNGSLVETSSLPIPLLDRIKGALAGEVEHEENGNSVVTDQWQHVDELPLTAEIPD